MKPIIRHARVAAVLALAALVFAAGCDKKKEEGKGDKPSSGAKDGLGAKHGGTPTSREGQMFLLGVKLAQAAMTNGRADAGVTARTFNVAKTVVDVTLHQPLEPLPAATGDGAKDGAAGMAYLLDGPGKALGAKIATDFGDSAVACYELGVKLNMLPMLYIDDPKDSMGDTMADVFGRLATKAKLPPDAMGPIIGKLEARAPMSEVTDLVFALNDSLPKTIGELYEKDDDKPTKTSALSE